MQHTETVEVPAKTETRIVLWTCDICGAATEDTDNWTGGNFDHSETTVKFSVGQVFPEGGSGTETTVDICPTCFTNKLLPWLEAQGAKPRTLKWHL